MLVLKPPLSNAIAWTLAALATHPDIQSKLVSELSTAGMVGPLGVRRQFEWGDVSRLPYLNAVIKESLRLFSPVYLGSSRLATQDIEIMGYKVPKVVPGVRWTAYDVCYRHLQLADLGGGEGEGGWGRGDGGRGRPNSLRTLEDRATFLALYPFIALY